MNILITGSTGFLGKNLSEKLSGKYSLLLPSHSELDLIDERQVEKYFRENNIDVVIHTAAVGVSRKDKNIKEISSVNLKMFYNLAGQEKYFKKMLFCGSGAVYGKQKDIKKVTEEEFGKNVPEDSYGIYKYECSKYILKSNNIIDLRMFGIYGKYEDYATRFISNAILRAIFGIPVIIIQNVKFDYLYVDDFVKIVEYFINNNVKERAYNLGTGIPVTLVEIAGKIEQITGKNLNITVKRQGWNKEYTCSNSRLLRELKGFQFSNLDSNIQILYNWYKKHKPDIKKEDLLFDK